MKERGVAAMGDLEIVPQRLARHWEARRGGVPSGEPHEWRHGHVPIHRPDYFPRPAEQRQVVRHKTYELAKATPDEAAFDMDLMDYDFHLFTDADSGQLYRRYRGHHGLVTPAG